MQYFRFIINEKRKTLYFISLSALQPAAAAGGGRDEPELPALPRDEYGYPVPLSWLRARA